MTRRSAAASIYAAVLIGGFAAATAVALQDYAGSNGSVSVDLTEGSGPTADPSDAAVSLNDVPGFGKTDDAALRDDTIAYWEAWRRDVLTQRCMRVAGFTWRPEVLFPGGAVAEVARGLGVAGSASTRSDKAQEFNQATRSSLDADSRNGYTLALYGETSRDLDTFESSGGQVPKGRDAETFATGGCAGKAIASVGSVWDLRRSLAADYEQLRRDARATPEFADALRNYTACFRQQSFDVATPADVDRLAGAGADLEKLADANQRCGPYWEAANDAGVAAVMPRFLADHTEAISAQQDEYERAMESIRRDEAFLDFLGS